MGLDVRISGAEQLRKVAAQIQATGDKGLGREMGRALNKAIEPIKTAIAESAAETMPSGYRGVLTASLKHRRTQRTAARTASLKLTTFAPGKRERRDVVRLNKGQLRHPVFGRRRKPWTTTAIRPGFYDRGTKGAMPEVEKRLGEVLDDFARRLAKG
jgi:hypothetical protein